MEKYLEKYLHLLSEKKKYLWTLLALSLVSSLFDLLSIGLIGPFVAAIAAPDEVTGFRIWATYIHFTGLSDVGSALIFLGFLIVVAFIAKAMVSVWLYRKIIKFAYQHQKDMRTKLLRGYQTLPYTFHLKRNSAELINIISIHTTVFTNSCLVPTLRMGAEIVVLFMILALLFVTNFWVATFLVIAVLAIFFCYDYYLKSAIERAGKDFATSNGEMIKHITQGISGMKEIRVFGTEAYFVSRLASNAEVYRCSGVKTYTLQILPRYIIEIFVVTCVVLLASLSILLHHPTELVISTLGIFSASALRLMPSAVVVIGGFNSIRNTRHVVEELYQDIITIEKNAMPLPGTVDLENHRHQNLSLSELRTVNFRRVTYRYPESNKDALHDVSIEIHAGTSIGIIGASGAGKTTLVDLLLGLYEPSRGTVLVNGRSIHEDLRAWLDKVAYIPQEVFIIDDTVRRNIALGIEDSEVNLDQLHFAIESAQLSDVVSQLDSGVDTKIGEKGSRLSGGQRQRIALARALYHRREVIIMDEATSALDNNTEEKIIAAIDQLKGQKTIVMIAHRLSTLERCDVIVNLAEGQVKEIGSFVEVVGSA